MATAAEEWMTQAGEELEENEDAVFALILRFMVRAMYDVGQDLLDELPPPGDLTRELVYAGMRNELLLGLGEYNDRLAAVIRQELDDSQVEMRELAAEYRDGPIDQPLETGDELMRRVIAWGFPLSVLFFRASPNSASEWMRQIFRLVDKKVRTGMFKQLPTEEIAESVTPGASGASARSVRITKGSVLSNVQSRTRGIISNAVWSGFTRQQGNVWAEVDGPWVWDAILDSVTCPRCAALDRQQRPRRSDFNPLPQLHDFCRCVVRPA